MIEDEVHTVPGDTIILKEYVDTSGSSIGYFERLYFSPNSQCDTAEIIKRYSRINLDLKKMCVLFSYHRLLVVTQKIKSYLDEFYYESKRINRHLSNSQEKEMGNGRNCKITCPGRI